jgi:CRP-like cAMP-binding protein
MLMHVDEDKRLATFRSIPLLRDVPEAELRELAAAAAEREFRGGEIVVREGEPGDELFLILDGQFQVFVRQEALDFEKELARLGPGNYFGEISVLTGDQRLASVRALTDGRVAVVHQRQLVEMVHRSPGVGLALCRGLVDYLTEARPFGQAVHLVHLEDFPGLKEAHRSERLRDLIEGEATSSEMAQALAPENFISMARYSRFLLREGIVAPERIREIFPNRRLTQGTAL